VTINWKAVPATFWVVVGAVALLLGLLWYVHRSSEREGAARAEEQRLVAVEHRAAAAREDSLKALVAAQSAQSVVDQKAAVVEQKAVVAQAHHILAKSKVRILSKDTLRVTTDTGTVDVPVPQEVTGLLVADSVVIAARDSQLVAKDAQLAARDSTIGAARGVIAADTVLLGAKDSVATSIRAEKSGSTLGTVVAVVIGTVITLAGLLHFLK
jgi:hypothetical protein